MCRKVPDAFQGDFEFLLKKVPFRRHFTNFNAHLLEPEVLHVRVWEHMVTNYAPVICNHCPSKYGEGSGGG